MLNTQQKDRIDINLTPKERAAGTEAANEFEK